MPQGHRGGKGIRADSGFGSATVDEREGKAQAVGSSLGVELCHVVLPCSNWEWVVPARSESFLSLKRGLQAALWQLGKAPHICQTDNSSTATHQLRRGRKERGFNEAYQHLLDHYGMKAETINVGAPHENGDVESSHRHLRDYLHDSLNLRGHRDFESHEAYIAFLAHNCYERNGNRQTALAAELVQMRPLPTRALPEYQYCDCRVNKDGIVRALKIGYSLPARWAGNRLRAHIYEDYVEFFHERTLVARVERRYGDRGTYVNWRHLLEALRRKPGAFRRYRYREHFFPSRVWRRAYDELQRTFSEGRTEREYLGLLSLALNETDQPHVEEAMEVFLRDGGLTLDAMKQAVGTCSSAQEVVTAMPVLEATLKDYDLLLEVGSDK